ncbi:hypothetical protein [Phenylobacterium sp.]|uniref:hypothetical protein n=1 Tax=Phenylobacterium sp. TaxID=1871053 RepID=UPI0012061543|nr:hypothetical protein [Phenylobacterium sp.]THD62791.1 MAG: hypothetical protein E8A49_06850 [Phenylobacterium sp.]
MRFLAMTVLAAALIAPSLLTPSGARAQDTPLDPNPATWHGAAFGPEQVFEGDYANDFQTSRFHAEGAPAGQDDWLAGWQDRPGDGGGILRRYHLKFVGRRTAAPGQYGGLGKYPNEVLITRLVSARLLIGDPKP